MIEYYDTDYSQCLCGKGDLSGTSSASTEQKHVVRLHFKREQLLYDIRNIAYVQGDVMSEDNKHARHQLQDIAEDGNVDRVTRILDLVHAAAVELLYPYTRQDPIDEELDDTLADKDEYVIEMHVPDKFSRTTARLLERWIHEWMVYRVLYDWLGIIWPDMAAIWQQKVQEAEDKIQELKNTRNGVLRRPLHPW